MNSPYVQYGCGLVAPEEWINYDASPTLRIQKLPLIGTLLKPKLNTIFPQNVRYGDIVRGLPLAMSSCKGLFCAHVLEHLSLNDFRTALENSYRLLAPGGIFRCVVPDLEEAANDYLNNLQNNDKSASIRFVGKKTLLGQESRPRGIYGLLVFLYGNSGHRWKWDKHSLETELRKVGFTNIRNCNYNDSSDPMFKLVETAENFENAAAFECIK